MRLMAFNVSYFKRNPLNMTYPVLTMNELHLTHVVLDTAFTFAASTEKKMELTTMMMFLSLNSSGNISTIDVDNNSSDDFNLSLLHFNESTSTEEAVPSFLPYNKVIWLLHLVVRPLFVVFGTYGNAVSFYIMRRGSLKKVSTCFYMAMLAIADTCVYITFLRGLQCSSHD